METFSSFLFYYSIAIATAIIVYIIGHLSLLFVKQDHENTAKSLSLKLFTGIIVLVSIFAIIKTHGNTIYSGLLLMLFFILYYYKKNNKLSFSNTQQNMRFFEVKEFVYFLFTVCVFLLFFKYFFLSRHLQLWFFYDYHVYSSVANNLLNKGIECDNIYIGMTGNTLEITPTFYHYFELWFTAIVKSIFNIKALYAIIFIVQPLLFSLIIVLAKSFVKQYIYNFNKILLCFILILIIIISSNAEILNLFLPHGHLQFITSYFVNFSNLKLSLVYICLFFVVINWEKPWFEKFIPLGILCFLYPTTLPVIVAGSLCFIIYLFIFEKHSFSWISIFYILTPAIFTATFYVFQKNNVSTPNSITISSLIFNKINHYSLRDVKIVIGEAFYNYGAFLLYLIPLVLVLKDYFQANKKLPKSFFHSIIFILIVFSISLIPYSLMFLIFNMGQFQSNLFFPLFNILRFIILIMLLKRKRYIFVFITYFIINVVTLLIYFYTNIPFSLLDSSKYISLKNEFSQQKFSSVYIRNRSSYKMTLDRATSCWGIPYPYLCRFTDNYYPICLSVFEIPKAKDIKESYCDNENLISPFYRFAGDTIGKSIDSLKKEFIKKYHIDYLFLEKGNTFSKIVKTMPIEKMISFEDEPYEIFKFKWK